MRGKPEAGGSDHADRIQERQVLTCPTTDTQSDTVLKGLPLRVRTSLLWWLFH
jgi:hypothetical protein